MAWVAYYNDFAVAREVNERLGTRRVGFSGAGSPRDAQPGQEGSIHHGPAPFILHIQNVMPVTLAGQLVAGQRFRFLPSIDLRGDSP